jgi:hypothetical protein
METGKSVEKSIQQTLRKKMTSSQSDILEYLNINKNELNTQVDVPILLPNACKYKPA